MSVITARIISAAADLLADRYTHTRLDLLFRAADAPGDAPDGSKVQKCQTWLMRVRELQEHASLAVLGRLLEEVMEEELGSGLIGAARR